MISVEADTPWFVVARLPPTWQGMPMTSRPPRAIRVDALELEGRLLLAALPVPSAVAATQKPVMAQIHLSLGFVGTPTPGTSQVTQVVYQQDGAATVTVSESGYVAMQVEVKTDPSSPAVGVNVGAVDQIVTFKNQTKATLSVPILAGAPNPGEVDVTLTATPLNPSSPVSISGPLVLRILASGPSKPPTITSEQGTPQGIVLTFSKPLDPAAASNVNNYAVRSTYATSSVFGGTLGFKLFGYQNHTFRNSVPLRAAVYDPATNSVTLIPRRRLTYKSQITVTQGSGSNKSSRPGHQSDASLGLTDLEGNPINGASTPGKFSVHVTTGDMQPVSTGNPQPVTTGNPQPVTTGNPQPVMTGNPQPVTTGNPQPATTGDPRPNTTGDPRPSRAQQKLNRQLAAAGR